MSIKFQVTRKYCLINVFSFYPHQSIIKGGKLGIKCIANFFHSWFLGDISISTGSWRTVILLQNLEWFSYKFSLEQEPIDTSIHLNADKSCRYYQSQLLLNFDDSYHYFSFSTESSKSLNLKMWQWWWSWWCWLIFFVKCFSPW